MARRKRLEAPDSKQLAALEDGFARETRKPGGLGPMPPIAQVAAEAAQDNGGRSEAARLEAAEAEAYRAALADGLIVQRIDLRDIAVDEIVRDRMNQSADAAEELQNSVRAHGVRLPIEVFALAEPRESGQRYGLISGWRRYNAVKLLQLETGEERFATVPAIVRTPAAAPELFVAMVEENEIRQNLSHYERGRVAVLAVKQGVFASVEEAVGALFSAGSKAKRSKIRSFAELHEELGDMLTFPQHLSERQGLRLVAALRGGFARETRAALATGQGVDPQAEWALLEEVIARYEAENAAPARPGKARPPAPPRETRYGRNYIQLANGISIVREVDSRGYSIRFEGKVVNSELVDLAMAEIQKLLEPI